MSKDEEVQEKLDDIKKVLENLKEISEVLKEELDKGKSNIFTDEDKS